MTLVVGENGDGKSTMIDALCFVLFGKPFRDINKPQLLNSIIKKDLLVEVEFSSRGRNYLVRRGMKPNLFEVWENGVLLNQDAKNTDYQAYFEKRILRTNFKTFTQIVILGSASYVPFMQLKAPERKKIIDDIYDLRVFTVMASILATRMTKCERDINTLENEKDMLEQRLELSKTHQSVRTEDKKKQIEAAIDGIDQALTEITNLEAKAHVLSQENKTLAPMVDERRRYFLKLREMDSLHIQIEANANSIRKEISFLNDHEDCPTCNQPIAPDFRNRVVFTKNTKLDEVTEGLRILGDKIAGFRQHWKSLSYADKTVNDNETQIIVITSQIKNQKNLISRLENEIAAIEQEQDEIVDSSALVEIETQITEKKREFAQLSRDKDKMGYLGVLLKDTGIKAQIVKKYSGTFNQLVNAYLAKFDFFVDFHLDENFEETIKSRGRDNFSYNSFSEGEKLRIDLAVLFAWRDIARMRASLNTNLLIMDEVFDGSLNAAGKEELMNIMRGVTVENNTFVISHGSSSFEDKFDRTLRFTKVKGFSRILE